METRNALLLGRLRGGPAGDRRPRRARDGDPRRRPPASVGTASSACSRPARPATSWCWPLDGHRLRRRHHRPGRGVAALRPRGRPPHRRGRSRRGARRRARERPGRGGARRPRRQSERLQAPVLTPMGGFATPGRPEVAQRSGQGQGGGAARRASPDAADVDQAGIEPGRLLAAPRSPVTSQSRAGRSPVPAQGERHGAPRGTGSP